MTKEEYENFVERFYVGILEFGGHFASVDGPDDTFSKSPCDICHRPLAGARSPCVAWDLGQERYELWVCPDCLYYNYYGRLDDMTMLEVEE